MSIENALQFASADQPLREDVGRLGAMVGDMLAEQVTPEFLAEVERVRHAAIARRQQGEPLDALAAQLANLEPSHAEQLVRAFGAYFQVVNIAERVHRIRRRRDYQRAGSAPQPEGLHDSLLKLQAQGVTLDELEAWLPRIDIEPVFTAHPTEAVRRALLEKEQLMVASLVNGLDGVQTPQEKSVDAARLRMALTAAWQTADSSPVRPTVEDEREHVGFYLSEVLYRVVPVFCETLETAVQDVFGAGIDMPRLLRFGTWVGGDMDGNPNVGADTIRDTLRAQRRVILSRYQSELKQLATLLSQSTELVGVSDGVLAKLAEYRALLPQVQSRPRHADMPYRLLNDLLRARLQATLDEAPAAYAAPDQFVADLKLVLDSLDANKGRHAGWFALRRLYWRVRTFGFHLARLDVRQESSVHARALSEGDDKVDAVFAALAEARRLHGDDALGVYIISMAHGREDVLNVLALAKRGGLVDANGHVPLDVAPLFETIEDLRNGADVLRDLAADDEYRAHLAQRGNVQMVMLGYSDSGKDGGIAASRWGLQRAQVELLDVANELGIKLTFFHGRGGSIVRGGGKTTSAVDAAPRGSIDGRLRVTEQGEVIHRKYGIRALALRSLEQATGAVLRASLRPRAPEPREAQWREVMDLVAGESSRAYRDFVATPRFMDYFRGATPIDVIERMTLGSRPSRRLGQDAALSNLRAIPWVFAWSQSRATIPGWFGVGSGLQAAVDAGHEATLRGMARDWPFFRTFLDDISMVLAKGDMGIAGMFSRMAGDELHATFFPRIEREHAATRDGVLRLLGEGFLLQHDQRLALSIRLRNPYVDPISVLQADLLRRWRAGGGEDEMSLRALVASVNGVAQGVQNTG